MRYPHFLACNGNIGFVAPSFGCATEPYITGFKKAQERFKNLGYGIVNGPNVYEANGIGISNTPELCGQELTDMYLVRRHLVQTSFIIPSLMQSAC